MKQKVRQNNQKAKNKFRATKKWNEMNNKACEELRKHDT